MGCGDNVFELVPFKFRGNGSDKDGAYRSSKTKRKIVNACVSEGIGQKTENGRHEKYERRSAPKKKQPPEINSSKEDVQRKQNRADGAS
ncbi:hypothetical protein ADLECEL_19610 [Adlercreutzia equolifaciens subsp. celatus]|nr:hypothetical protein ADLECEL_19610 [Adlercreutzia equolifaciens subsp. celatus]